jgi:hypothetical protein
MYCNVLAINNVLPPLPVLLQQFWVKPSGDNRVYYRVVFAAVVHGIRCYEEVATAVGVETAAVEVISLLVRKAEEPCVNDGNDKLLLQILNSRKSAAAKIVLSTEV